MASWKSTVSGILTATLATSAAFLAPPLNTLASPKVILWLGAFQIVGKIWIALLTKDAESVTSADVAKANNAVTTDSLKEIK